MTTALANKAAQVVNKGLQVDLLLDFVRVRRVSGSFGSMGEGDGEHGGADRPGPVEDHVGVDVNEGG